MYTQSLLYSSENDTHISLKTLWTKPTKSKGNTLIIIGAKSVNGSADQWMIPIGIGYQTIGKSLAYYLCVGFGQYTNYDPGSYEIYTSLAFSFDFGILIGIPMQNPKISIPLEASLVAEAGVAITTGLAIQFNLTK
jgi:hypothetical protein